MKRSITSRKQIGIISVVLIILGWHLVATLIKLPLILPTPQAAFNQILLLIMKREFWHHIGATLGRGLTGFGIAFLIGMVFGVLSGRFPVIEALMRPIMICIQSTPSMSIILIALIWFRGEYVSIFVTFLVTFPVIFQNIVKGIESVDRDLRVMVRLYQVKRWRRFLYLYLPTVVPFLAASISAGLGLTWRVLIAAEVLSYPNWGIGSQIDTARTFLQTDKVFAWTIVVVVMGLTLDYSVDYMVRKPFSHWKAVKHD